ncbi:MAG: helix-turn-helix domain-containing protein [Gammaproteobacteria bacterium]|nr:helix-turn-helix domain-containing protein [Gammaproteobacteria bacterium]
MEPTPLLKPKEAAAFLAIGLSTLERWMTEERVPVFRLPSGRPRFDAEELREWLRAGSPPATAFRRRRVAVKRRRR